MSSRQNVILMGDSLGDAEMADGVPNTDAVLKIGFLYGDVCYFVQCIIICNEYQYLILILFSLLNNLIGISSSLSILGAF